jgi:hypothetical protein
MLCCGSAALVLVRIRIRIRNVDPEQNQYGSGSTTLFKVKPGSDQIQYICVYFFRERRVRLSILVGGTELRDQV